MRMMTYHTQVAYVPGKLLIVADALSRQPVETTDSSLQQILDLHGQEDPECHPPTADKEQLVPCLQSLSSHLP